MKKLRLLSVALLAATGAMSMASCSTQIGSKYVVGQKVKVGLICLHSESSTYDKNFIDAWKSAFKNNDRVTFDEACIKTDIAEDENAYEAAKALVKQGCNMIFADSFGHGDYIKKAADEFPYVQFCHATGTGALTGGLNNLHNAFASIYEGRYIEGYAAGLALKNKGHTDTTEAIKAGYVGAHPYAEVKSGYTSWYLGLREVFPNATMDVEFTNSWYSEAAEREKANSLISSGCVVISQHADSMGAPNACQNATSKPLNVCYNVSTETVCNDTYVGYSSINWEPYYRAVVDAMYTGTTIEGEVARNFTGSLKDHSVNYAFTSNRSILTADDILELEVVASRLKLSKNTAAEIFDCSKFTLTVTDKKNKGAVVDQTGHLTSYFADTDGDYQGDREAVLTTDDEEQTKYFAESTFRSAPYFDLDIDGITLK